MLLYVNRLGTGSLYQSSEPLGLKALAAFVDEKDYSSRVYSGPVHEAAKMAAAGAGSEKPFDAVGLYCDFETVSAVESFSRFIKENTSARVFVGGPQAVALGEDFLKNSRCDAIVRGEGEYPFYELLEFFLHGRGKLEDIAGASFFDAAGFFVKIPPRPPIAKIDELPIRKTGADGASDKTSKNYSILTGRGCPFRCAFCYEGSVSGGVRLRSVENSLGEIRQALEYNPSIKYIWFADDTFTLNPSRMEAFSKGLAELRRNFDFVWFCECHPSAMIKWPDTLPMMIESGLVRMQIGMESGDAGIINLYKKQAGLEDIQKAAELSYKSGLPQLTGNMIIGGAAETPLTFSHTVSFAKKLIDIGPGMTDVTSTFFLPLPETAITLDPAGYGMKILDPEALTSIGDMAVIETKKLSRERIVSMRCEFTRSVLRRMIDLYKKGRVPLKRITDEFRINQNYGLESSWYKVVYSPDRFIADYFKKMASGDFIFTGGAAAETLMRLYPALIMDAVEMIDLTGDFPAIGGYVLSPLEYGLLSLCRGGLPLHALIDKLFEMFGGNYSSKNEFSRKAIKLMKVFEEKFWIGYSEKPCGAGGLALKTVPDKCAARAVIDMPAGAGFKECAEAVEKCLKAGVKVIAGRIAPEALSCDIASVRKTAVAAIALIDKYAGVFEAYYDDGYLKNAGFKNDEEREKHMAAAQITKTDILKEMSKASAVRKIDYETILLHFRLHEEDGVDSIYYARIFSRDPLIYNYFTIVSRGGARRSSDIAAGIESGRGGLSSFRPQRTMAIWTAVDFDRGYPAVGGYVLSPLEYELLLHCTGKSTLAEIYKIMNAKFPRCFGGLDELKKSVNKILSDFEKKYWILYSRL